MSEVKEFKVPINIDVEMTGYTVEEALIIALVTANKNKATNFIILMNEKIHDKVSMAELLHDKDELQITIDDIIFGNFDDIVKFIEVNTTYKYCDECELFYNVLNGDYIAEYESCFMCSLDMMDDEEKMERLTEFLDKEK